MNILNLFNYIEKEVLGSDLLEKANIVDFCANGIQITGKDEVKKVAFGVSCNEESLQKAVSMEADVCIFHHGLNLNKYGIYNSRLSLPVQKELDLIFKHRLIVASYHYTLDSHPEIGNNAQIIEKLGAKRLNETYFENWGWVGEFEQEKTVPELLEKCKDLFNHEIYSVTYGPERIKRIGVCSGSAKPFGQTLFEIDSKKIDLHISGEIIESEPSVAREAGFNYFSCGHYATEVFGVKALAEKIKNKFPELEIEFIDAWNEL